MNDKNEWSQKTNLSDSTENWTERMLYNTKIKGKPWKIKKLLKIFLIFYVQKMGEKSPFFDFPGLLNNTKISKTKKTKKLKNKKLKQKI